MKHQQEDKEILVEYGIRNHKYEAEERSKQMQSGLLRL